jgi:hypothetical protein
MKEFFVLILYGLIILLTYLFVIILALGIPVAVILGFFYAIAKIFS